MKKTKLIIAVCIFFIGVGAVLALYIMPRIYEEKEVFDETQNVEKPVVTDYACWQAYTFEEAIEASTTIAYGKVKNISGTLLHEVPTPDGQVYREYYKNVTVEVLEAIKGVAAQETTTTYLELGGETEDAIYVLEGVDPVAIGEEYIFFLNKHGAFMSPATLVPVSDGVVQIRGMIHPETSSEQQAYAAGAQSEEYNLEQYITAIREELAE